MSEQLTLERQGHDKHKTKNSNKQTHEKRTTTRIKSRCFCHKKRVTLSYYSRIAESVSQDHPAQQHKYINKFN